MDAHLATYLYEHLMNNAFKRKVYLFCSVPSARDEPPEPSDPEAARSLLCISCSRGLEGIDILY